MWHCFLLTRFQFIFFLVAEAVASLSVCIAADTYPTRPVRIIVPYAAGGPTDVMARVVAAELAKRWAQPLIIENRPGANANIGAALAAHAQPDGYTLFVGTFSTHGINQSVYQKLQYDAVHDFTPIVPLSDSILYLAVNARLPVNTLPELIDYIRRRPGEINCGTVGPGSLHQIALHELLAATGTKMVEVAYKGTSPAMTALMAGEIEVLFDAAAMQYAPGGNIRVLAVTSKDRWPLTPSIPTIKEQGVDLFDLPNGWFGLFAPIKLPVDIVEKINRDVNDVLRMPDVQSRLAVIGHVGVGGTDADLRQRVQSSLDYGARIVGPMNLKLDQ